MAEKKAKRAGTSLKIKPANPFDLVRWLARSQSDPRKAVAELVQNSLDAGATHVDVRRYRVKGTMCLAVTDDGEGVLPEMDREDALRYLATHVGHSRKLGLDPAERAQRVIAGKYGVGLLGFWSIGEHFELRTRVGGSHLMSLHMKENSPDAQIARLALKLDATPTFTEVVVTELHPAAEKQLSGRRLSDYLAAELRGHLLRREIELVVRDDVARGLAQKRFVVTPRRFSGERLLLPAEIPVPDHTPMRLELYLSRGAERPQIQVACAGTLVADDIGALDALGLGEAPWVGRELTGIVDFSGFNVPPGTRRGVLPDSAAAAFVSALESLLPQVTAELERLDGERRATLDRDVVLELQRALRGFSRRLPQYDLPRAAADEGGEGPAEPGGPLKPGAGEPRPREQSLFPPGPLARVRIVPDEIRVPRGGQRRIRAVACDADDRTLDDVLFAWTTCDDAGLGVAIVGDGPRPAVTVRPEAPVEGEAQVRVEATEGSRVVSAEATLRVAEIEDQRSAPGIPEPQLVSDAEGSWRSRMSGERWEVNDAHEDYRELRGAPRARVRYLLTLLAREIVLRTSGRPEAADVLDSLVEILAHAERNLRGA